VLPHPKVCGLCGVLDAQNAHPRPEGCGFRNAF